MDVDKTGLLIVSIVAVVGLLGILSLSLGNDVNDVGSDWDVTGQAIAEENYAAFGITGRVVDNNSVTCTDSDNGLNYAIKGMITGGGISFSQNDYCLILTSGGQIDSASCDGTDPNCRLHEFYCQDGLRRAERTQCPNGCSNGACVTTIPQVCTDSDGGYDRFKYGEVLVTGGPSNLVPSGKDRCYLLNSGPVTSCSGNLCTLEEYSCKDYNGDGIKESYGSGVENAPCPNGCSNGACLSAPVQTCTDSDGGMNYDVKGSIVGVLGGTNDLTVDGAIYHAGTVVSLTDTCNAYNPNNLDEYYCQDNVVRVMGYTCPNGCSNGACLKNTTTYVPFILAFSEISPASDMVLGTYVTQQLFSKGLIPSQTGMGKLFGEVDALDLNNRVTLAIYSGSAVIIVGANSPSSHVMFATEISKALSVKGTPVRVMLSSEIKSSDLMDLFTIPSCTDSDGGNLPYTSGEACSGNECQRDYCNFLVGKNAQVEAVCENGQINRKNFTCSGSTPYCYEGACSTRDPVCTDTDGGQYAEKLGSVYVHHLPGLDAYTDYCEIGTTPVASCNGSTCRVREFYCAGLIVGPADIACPYGCNNGVCSPVLNTTSNTTVYRYNEVCGDDIVGMYEDCDGNNIRTGGYAEFTLTKSSTGNGLAMTMDGKEYNISLMGTNIQSPNSVYIILSVNGQTSTMTLSQPKVISGLYLYIKSVSVVPGNIDQAAVTLIAKGRQIEECTGLSFDDYYFEDGELSCTDNCKYDTSECTLTEPSFCDTNQVYLVEDDIYSIISGGKDYTFEVKSIAYQGEGDEDTETVFGVETEGLSYTYTLNEKEQRTVNGLTFYLKDIFRDNLGNMTPKDTVAVCFDVKPAPLEEVEPSFCDANKVYLVEDDVYRITSGGQNYTFEIKKIAYNGNGDEDTDVVLRLETEGKQYTYTLFNKEQMTVNDLTFYVNDIFVDNVGTASRGTVEMCFDVQSEPLAKLTLSDFPQPFITKDHIVNAVFIVGRQASIDDVIGISDITASLQRYASENPFPVGIVKFDDEVSDDVLYNSNLVIVGGMCANRATAKLYGYPTGYSENCISQDDPGRGHIKVIRNKNPDKLVLLVHGHSALDTTMATRVIAQWEDYADAFKDSESLCVYGSLSNMNVRDC